MNAERKQRILNLIEVKRLASHDADALVPRPHSRPELWLSADQSSRTGVHGVMLGMKEDKFGMKPFWNVCFWVEGIFPTMPVEFLLN